MCADVETPVASTSTASAFVVPSVSSIRTNSDDGISGAVDTTNSDPATVAVHQAINVDA